MKEEAGIQLESDTKKPENRELPPLSIEIYYSAHGNAKDIGELQEKFLEADIYVPEWIGTSLKVLETYQAVSDGRKTPAEAVIELHLDDSKMYGYHLKRFEIIYGSHKPVVFVDVPLDHDLIKEYREILFKPKLQNFEEDLEYTKDFLLKEAVFEKKREEYMILQLEPKMREVVEKYPELQNKKQLKLLLSLGAFHTGLFHELDKKAYDVKREFGDTPIVFDSRSEALRRHMFDKKVGDELVLRAMFETLVGKYFSKDFKKKSDDSLEQLKMLREVGALFSFDEMKNLYSNPENKGGFESALYDAVNQKLKVEWKKQKNDSR
ncbi:MAG: hypothetical protein Q7S12_01590 [bacterium]|nr:hypothetical protein [bacterium]